MEIFSRDRPSARNGMWEMEAGKREVRSVDKSMGLALGHSAGSYDEKG